MPSTCGRIGADGRSPTTSATLNSIERCASWSQATVCQSWQAKMAKGSFTPVQGDGLYTAMLIKVLAYLLALRLQAHGVFSTLTITQIMRKLRREEDLGEFLAMHFHAPFSIT